jgi:hypothetical protein
MAKRNDLVVLHLAGLLPPLDRLRPATDELKALDGYLRQLHDAASTYVLRISPPLLVSSLFKYVLVFVL